jgi:hypothetical protein
MSIERGHKRARFVCGDIEQRILDEHQPVTIDPQMNGIGTQPVRVARRGAIELERERRYWPVMLTLDVVRFAEPAFGRDRGRALSTRAREQFRER